jgi:co-chaperonin GroES (HSP10)
MMPPLHDNVLIRPAFEGIVSISGAPIDKYRVVSMTGKVLSIGRQAIDASRRVDTMDLEAGQTVVFGGAKTTYTTTENEELLIVPYKNVLAVID